MKQIISSVTPGSPASGRRIYPGDELIGINGHKIHDVLDYTYYSYDSDLLIELVGGNGKLRFVRISKAEGQDPGLNFETYLMDRPMACANKCVFCFIDQLPPGMRETLYFKDDDARLSFLQGNYITLTNLSDREMERISSLKVSPINVSVHATDPGIRCRMLGNRTAGKLMDRMRMLSSHGVIMNCQIVCCPGFNDGEVLQRTMTDLTALYPSVPSVSVVPVGLTKYREGLEPLTPFDPESAAALLDQVEEYGNRCLDRCGSRIFFPADEFYIKAERELPPDDWYEGYPQLENGVGMLRLLITEFEETVGNISAEPVPFTAATGVSAYPYIRTLLERARTLCPEADGIVLPVENRFFGSSIDVAGLLTGRDIAEQLKGKIHGTRLLIPRNALRHGDRVFLDDVTVEDLERELNVSIRIVEQDGADLAAAFFGK